MWEASPAPTSFESGESGAQGSGLTLHEEATNSEEMVLPHGDGPPLPAVSKPRKTVRFGDESPQPMSVDDNNEGPMPMDVDEIHVLRDITKTCELGSMRALRVVFKGISSGLLSTQLAELEQAEKLNFTHTCSEADFILANAGIRASTIVTGRIGPGEAPDVRGALNTLNARLVIRNQALLCYVGSLCVLLKPWTASDRAAGAQNLNPDLKEDPCFEIFRPTEAFEPGILEDFEPNGRQSAPCVRTRRSFGIDNFLQFDVGHLLPRNLMGSEPPSFFLLFPDSAQDECSVFVQWLRQCDSSCGVFISAISANWSHFRSLHNGVVIIHQDATEMVRLLPGLGDLLRQPDSDLNFTLWSFGHVNRAVCPDQTTDPMTDSMMDSMPDSTQQPAQDTIVLEPLFLGGSVFLMTPSFLLAQPHCAYTFLKWFWQENIENPPIGPLCKLVLFAGVEDWMTDVLVDLVAQADDRFDEDDAEIQDEITVRTKTQRLVTRLLSLTEDSVDDMPTSPVLVTSEFIDANDEQSIVNWFSWWATQHVREFRRFEVVGTGHSDRFRPSRPIRAPRYAKSSIIDEGAPSDDDGKDGLSEQHPPGEATYQAQEALTLRQAVSTLYTRLAEIEQDMLRCKPPAIMFRRPVSYFGPGMAVHLGEPGSKLSSFDEWFAFFRPLRTFKGPRNTYIGVFYTISEECNPDTHPSEVVPPSRPWFAVFRPRNPHRKPWIATELFIWDTYHTRTLAEKRAFYESDLIPAQQALIDMIAEKTGDSSSQPHPALEKVWIGAHETSDPSANPVDHTLNRLQELIGNFKSDLHARSDLTHLGGWEVVERGARPLESREPPRKIEHPRHFSLGDSETEDEVVPRKIVFHPPKGDKKLYSRQIENRLLKEAQKAKNVRREEFSFLFAPTQQWYGFLKPTKRHSEHIRVVQWSKLFKELGLHVREQ
jgi:chromo domain-containing protein 1